MSHVAPQKAKIAVIYYSTYGHITKLTDAVVEGAKGTGAHVDVFQIPETLSKEILEKQYAIPRPDLPIIGPHQLPEYDGFIFGFPTRYGRAPAQVSAFFDSTGKEWASGALVGKFATMFTSTASQHGGIETTALTTMPFFIHHGISYVPSGFASAELTKLDEIIGGSAYGAGTIAGGDGSRQPIEADYAVARAQGKHFCSIVNTFVAGKAAVSAYERSSSHGQSEAYTTTAAEAVPASVMSANDATMYPVDGSKSGYTVDENAGSAGAAATTSAPVQAPVAEKPAATVQPTTAATEKPAATTVPKKEKKKGGLFARCCGNEDDYAK